MAYRPYRDLDSVYRIKEEEAAKALKEFKEYLKARSYDAPVRSGWYWYDYLRLIVLYIVLAIGIFMIAKRYLRNNHGEGDHNDHDAAQGRQPGDQGQWHVNRAAPLADTLAGILLWIVWPFRLLTTAVRKAYVYAVDATPGIRNKLRTLRNFRETQWWEWAYLQYQYACHWFNRNALYMLFALCGLFTAYNLGRVFMKEAGIGPWSGQPRYYRPRPIMSVYSQPREERYWSTRSRPSDPFAEEKRTVDETWDEAFYASLSSRSTAWQSTETSLTERSIQKTAAPSKSPRPVVPQQTPTADEGHLADSSLPEPTQVPIDSNREDWSEATTIRDTWNIYEPVSNIASSLLAKQERPRLEHRHAHPIDKRTYVPGKMVWCSSCKQWHCCELPY